MLNKTTHSYHVACLVYNMGRELGLTKEELKVLFKCGLYHDIGKEKISSNILNKPAKLTNIEFNVITLHSVLGAEMLADDEVEDVIIDAVKHHHERYDGTGYPAGLKGEDIPLYARIVAIADAFDAITTPRPYSKPRTNVEALNEIKSNAGTQFDPYLVEKFKNILLDSTYNIVW